MQLNFTHKHAEAAVDAVIAELEGRKGLLDLGRLRAEDEEIYDEVMASCIVEAFKAVERFDRRLEKSRPDRKPSL